MAITVQEKWDSRAYTGGENPSATLKFIVSGTTSDVDAEDALLATAPEIYTELYRQSWSVDPLVIDTTGINQSLWEGTVRYGLLEQNETGDSVFNFDTTGGTQHITQSLSTINSYAASGTPPDYKGAIGATEKSVEGVDIVLPKFGFSETHFLAVELVTPAYRDTLFRMTGKINNLPFRWFAPGECLFMGAVGAKRGYEDWEVSFKFAASPNQIGIQVGDIADIEKLGWDYMWVSYEDTEDSAAKRLVKRPVSVHIERVYEFADFTLLGIGA